MRGHHGRFRGRGRGFQRGANRGHRWNDGFRGRRGSGTGPPIANERQNKNFAQRVGPRLAEVDVGISEYISKHDGFLTVMKHRHSDFLVNEIDHDGNIVKLTSLDVPVDEASSTCIERHELIPIEIWEQLQNLVRSKPANSLTKTKEKDGFSADKSCEPENSIQSANPLSDVENSSNLSSKDNSGSQPSLDCNQGGTSIVSSSPLRKSVEFDVTTLDKDSRRIIHKCVKGAFKNLNSNTVDKGGKKYVVFSLGSDGKRENRGKWPESRAGEYLYFVVHKRNQDTTDVVNAITSKLRMKPSSLTFAGTKDRRGNTSQLMSIRRGEPSRLFHLSKGLRDVFIGNYCFKRNPLRLGDLKGNQFKIVLRNAEGSDEQIKAGLESLKTYGFINYYGLQRFGTNITVPTHSVGKYLLLGDWEKAVSLILEPREGCDFTKAALNEWKANHDAKAALEKLDGWSYSLEKLLLKGLVNHGPNDFVNALSMIPPNTRLMYLHAYQSYIWNQTVSYRIREFGLKPIVGDLVAVKSDKDISVIEIDVDTEDVALLNSIARKSEECNNLQEVKHIKEEDIKSYRIEDVLLPLPGHSVTYPTNSVGSFMINLLKEDGLSSEKLLHHVKQYSVKGTYRRIISRVDNLSWNIVHYDNPEADLLLSDYDELMGKKPPPDMKDGKFRAIIMSMSLEPSTYATMAVREVTKKDTSAAMQASISASTESANDTNDTLQSNFTEVMEEGRELQKLSKDIDTELTCNKESPKLDGVEMVAIESSDHTTVCMSDTPGTSIPVSEQPLNESVNELKRKAIDVSDEVAAEKRIKEA